MLIVFVGNSDVETALPRNYIAAQSGACLCNLIFVLLPLIWCRGCLFYGVILQEMWRKGWGCYRPLDGST
jgi:hypothetical protein